LPIVVKRCLYYKQNFCAFAKDKIIALKQLKALGFLQALDESADWALLSSFCHD